MIAVTTGLTGLIVGGLIARRTVRAAVAQFAPSIVATTCREAWSFVGPGDMRAFAYDPAGRSTNPRAPSIDRDLLARLPARPGEAVWNIYSLGGRGRMLLRALDHGPCAIVQVAYTPGLLVPGLPRTIIGSVLGSLVLSLALWLIWVARPLSLRARNLGRAAARLDQLAGATKITAGDELDTVLDALVAADARIQGDRALLAQRSTALERHLSEVAHDVRTPLFALQLAVEQAADLSADPAVRELLGAALRDSVYLADLTENLRMQSLFNEGWSPAQAPTDLGAALDRICLRAASLGRRRGIEVVCARPDDPVTVQCDALAFERAVTNIVDNAVAYGEAGGHVAATLAANAQAFALVILDDGPGIGAHEVADLTARRFRTSEARTRDPRGSGLGLFITSQICACFGWELTFEAAHPHGLRVTITGPLTH